jgi:hypothetical protein
MNHHAKHVRLEIALVAGLLAFLVARTWIMPMFASLWIDEWSTYQIGSEGPRRIEALARAHISDQRLISLAAWLGMQLVGHNEFGLRLYSLLSGGFCLLAIYRLGRRWFDARTALLSMLLFPCLQAICQQASNARAYMLATALFLSLLWSVELWLERRRWYWLLLGAVAGYLLVLTHLMATLGLGLVGLRLVWTIRPWTQWVRPFIILLPGFAQAVWQVVHRPVSNLSFASIPTPVEVLQALVPQPAAGLLLVVLAAVLGLRLGAWNGPAHRDEAGSPAMLHFVLAAWLLPPLLLYGFSLATGTSIFLGRYYIIAFPAAAWMLGWILARLEPFLWRAATTALIAVASMVILAGTQARPSPNHENWRGALAVLGRMRLSATEPVLFYCGFMETNFPEWREYYKPDRMCRGGMMFYRFDGNIIGLPYTARPDRIGDLKPQLDATLASNKRVWLLSQQPDGPVIDWLDGYLAAKGWKSRSMGFFDQVRLDFLEPGPEAEQGRPATAHSLSPGPP